MSLEDIYQQIPSMTCKQGCADCCGPVPFTDEEWEKVKDRPKRKQDENLKCQFLIDSKCSIYADRPFMCRLFGTTKDIKILECPHDYKPFFPIPKKRANELTEKILQYKSTLRDIMM